MKAIVQHDYGTPEVLTYADVDRPVPGDEEVLVRVHAASVGPWVWRMVGPDPRIMRIAGGGLSKPKRTIPGADMAGRVEAVGEQVTSLQPGDEVYGEADGCFAEFVCAAADACAPKPVDLDFVQAAAVPVAGNTALLGLRDHGHVEPGQQVLVIGASGGVGTFAVQIAKAIGARVTGVCSTDSMDTVLALGADEVVDYTKQDVTAGPERYDLIFQLAGTQSAAQLRRALTPEGIVVLSSGEGGPLVGPIGRLLTAIVTSPFVSQTYKPFYATPDRENLLALTELIESGQVEPMIDRTYPLSEAAEAVRSAQHDHIRGKIVLTV